MTKRTEIAVRILQGLFANAHTAVIDTPHRDLIALAFRVADDVITEGECTLDSGQTTAEEAGKAWNEANSKNMPLT